MYQRNAELQWTDEQWNRVHKVVADEAQRVRLATKFLPVYGPVDSKELAVPNFWLQPGAIPAPPGAAAGAAVNRLTVESLPLKLLTTIAINVYVRTHEAADPELGAVMSMFRRAANLIARTEDALMFNGQAAAAAVPPGLAAGAVVGANVTGGSPQYGLLGSLAFGLPNFVAGWAGGGAGFPAAPAFPIARGANTVAAPPVAGQASTVVLQAGLGRAALGQEMVLAVSKALGSLENCGYTGPFACVLGSNLFDAVHDPTAALVLPRDRILPFLEGGPLLRSSLIDPDQGVIVAYGSGQVEQVLASDICVKLLQVSEEPRYVFRICERVALRVRDWNAVVNIC
jgi:uncharacterized linocin/CFP29 family protein